MGDIWEHILRYPPIETQKGHTYPTDSVKHELLVIMSPDCDLDWDFKARFPTNEILEQTLSPYDFSETGKTLLHVLLTKIYKEERIRPQISPGSDIWKRIKQNQDERYHHLPQASIGGDPPVDVPDLYIDFKKALTIPTQRLYEGLRGGGIKRIALIPDKYIHNLMHRFYGFLSRVAVPEL